MALSFEDARSLIVADVRARSAPAQVEAVALGEAAGRVLAEDVLVDRDLPPFDRSTRDGFAVRAADANRLLTVVGEVRAGQTYAGRVETSQAVEIMTGAPLPAGADAVVMIEHVTLDGKGHVGVQRAPASGDNIVPAGSEAKRGAIAVARGTRLDPGSIALCAAVGAARPRVYAQPRVAILPTGDELVDVTATPGPAQIRNSNAVMLAAQVTRAGGTAIAIPPAPDSYAPLRAAIERGLAEADLLVLSGGVSMGKYDLVEQVLAELGAEIRFDGANIRPGRPAVFGWVRGKPFFGLPGNPLSTLCTFELFARPAIELAGGAADARLALLSVPLAAAFTQRELALTVFVPATLEGEPTRPAARALSSQGSGDLFAIARAAGWIVIPPRVTSLPAGAPVGFLPL